MFNSNHHQVPGHPNTPLFYASSAVGQDASAVAQTGGLFRAESVVGNSKKLQDDLRMLGLKIKQHEDNIKLLKTHKTRLDESILDMQVSLGKYHSSSLPVSENDDLSRVQSEQETVESILRHEKTAAGIFLQLRNRGSQVPQPQLTKDILGIVAALGKVDDDNLSRLLSEYLGIETMLAVVCKTYDGARALETYDKDGSIVRGAGLHGLGAAIDRPLDGRFLVICLENLRPYSGEFIMDDPQRRLNLVKPKLPNGEIPPGFLGFAVNMIMVDSSNVFYITSHGDGLRETLFYLLFSHLQVYRTRTEMLQALPCISHGAVSLDGGMIRSSGVLSLGNRKETDVKFPKSHEIRNVPENYIETEGRLKEKKWEKERMVEDIQREQTLLDSARVTYEVKKQEFLKFIAESSSYMAHSQHQIQTGLERLTPR